MVENGLEARVHTLESKVDSVEERASEDRQCNSDEHKELKKSIGKVMGIGVAILVTIVVGFLEEQLRH